MKLEQHMMEAAVEALREKNVNKNADFQKKFWFSSKMKEFEKKGSRLNNKKYLNKSLEEHQRYKDTRNRVKAEILWLKGVEAFTADMEHDLYGAQRKVWGMRRRKKEINEYVQSQLISKKEWTSYFRKLYQEEAEEHVKGERNFVASTHERLKPSSKTSQTLKEQKST